MARSFSTKYIRPEDVDFWSVAAFLAIVALTGGSAHAGSIGQAVAQIAATLAAAGWIAFLRSSDDRWLWPAMAFLGVCAALICLQLIPLPPALWRGLPGRDAHATAAALAGVADHWRPLSLTPDLTWSSLFALIVPASLLIGLSRLSSRRRAELMLPFAGLIFASGVLGLAQVSGGPASPLRWYGGNPDPSAVGFLANRNHQALLLACALPILAAIASLPGSRPKQRLTYRWAALGIGAFILLMLPTTGSRAGLALGGVASLLAVAIAAPTMLARLRKLSSRRRNRVLAATAIGMVAFIAILVFMGRNVAFSRLTSLDPLDDLRVRTLPVVIEMTKTFWPWGAGFGTFDDAFRQFEPFDLLKRSYFNQAHNDILQIVLEGGALAALLLIAFLGWWLVATVRAWRAESTIQALAARAGSGIILLCLLASIVDYPLRTSLVLSLFCIAGVWLLTPVSARAERDDTL